MRTNKSKGPNAPPPAPPQTSTFGEGSLKPNEVEQARALLKKDMEENIRLAQMEIQAILQKRGLKLEAVAQTLLVPK